MKGLKDEEKLSGPLFPRLHVYDAEKGGPKAPPRNKMALYEQLSIPSGRFNSGSAPLLPNNSGFLVPSTSCVNGDGKARSLYTPFCNSTASYLSERLHSYSSAGMNVMPSTNLEGRPMTPTKCHTMNAAGHLSMIANCSYPRPQSTSNSKNSTIRKFGDGDDYKGPYFLPSGGTPEYGDGQLKKDKKKLSNSSSNRQLQTARVLKQIGTRELVSRQQVTNQTEDNSTSSPNYEECATEPASIMTKGDKLLVDAFSRSLAWGRISEQLKGVPASLSEGKRSNLVDGSIRSHDSNAQLPHKYTALQDRNEPRNGVSAEFKRTVGKRNASTLEGVSCFSLSPGDNNRRSSEGRFENFSECHEHKSGSIQQEEVSRDADMSETSILDCTKGLDVSPDDVVEVIGQKQFWKARRAIVHQQRVFAVQVFELHRLIKVQRFFAASPYLLLESELYTRKTSKKALHAKKLPLENVAEAQALVSKWRDDPQKTNANADYETPIKGFTTHHSTHKPYSVTNPPAITATEVKQAPWWLVPVMSPSEGLIYKPYTGPCHSSTGYIASVYGGSKTMNLSPVGGDFLIAACGIPQLGQTNFSRHGMPLPLVNPSVSSSAVEQVYFDTLSRIRLRLSGDQSRSHHWYQSRRSNRISIMTDQIQINQVEQKFARLEASTTTISDTMRRLEEAIWRPVEDDVRKGR